MGGRGEAQASPAPAEVIDFSDGHTLEVWDLQAGTCLLTSVATTAIAIVAGADAGAVWFLDWPPEATRQGATADDRRPDEQPLVLPIPSFLRRGRRR